jgi:flagellar basal-body rod protein FlgG
MSQSLHTAAAGLAAQQRIIDTIAGNIANINTNGYKGSRLEFADAIYSAMQNPALPADGQTGNLQLGHGLVGIGVTRDFGSGPLVETGRSLDFALAGSGWFAIAAGDGSVQFTRDGSFNQMQANGRHWLITQNGQSVLDRNGQPIGADVPLDKLAVDPNGRLTLDGVQIGELGLVDFANQGGLEAVGFNAFQATEASGQPAATVAEVYQGFGEGSNVSLAGEMTSLMQAQRAYALMGRAITTADQMRATENDIRR